MPEIINQGVGGKIVSATSEFVRPANTTPYTAGDVVSNDATTTVLLTFPTVIRTAGGSGYVTKVRLATDKKDEAAQYRLFFYKAPAAAAVTGGPSVTVPADNAADTTVYADRANLIGFVDLPACTAGAGTSGNTGAVSLWTGTPLAFTGYAGTTNVPADQGIYGKLVNMTGTTPASGQKFSVTIDVDQN